MNSDADQVLEQAFKVADYDTHKYLEKHVTY